MLLMFEFLDNFPCELKFKISALMIFHELKFNQDTNFLELQLSKLPYNCMLLNITHNKTQGQVPLQINSNYIIH